jgi:hypothetical protein
VENWTLVATLLDWCRDGVLLVRQREARGVPLGATASVVSRWLTVASSKTWFSRVGFSRPW